MFKKIIPATLALALVASNVFSSGQITHLVIALDWLKFCKYSEKDTRSFLRGTIFPDIRYPAKLKRGCTHDKNVSLKDVVSCKDPFLAGKKFHAFVDETRDAFLKRYKAQDKNIDERYNNSYPIYSELKFLKEDQKNNRRYDFLSFVEDQISFNREKDFKFYIDSLSANNIDEKAYYQGAKPDQVVKWYNNLQVYFKKGPQKSFKNVAKKGGYHPCLSCEKKEYFEQYKKVCSLYSENLILYAKNEVILKCFLGLRKRFKKLFKEFASNSDYDSDYDEKLNEEELRYHYGLNNFKNRYE